MDAPSFAERWSRKEQEYRLEAIPLMPCGDVLLPREVGSCQGFNLYESPKRLWDTWGTPHDWSRDDRERLAQYLMIGFDGAGNPFCIQESDGTVWMLDHEDWFHTRQFMNSSAVQLAEALLARMGESDAAHFREAVRRLDPAAMAAETFWWYEAAMMSGD